MWGQLQTGMLALFVLFAIFTIVCQVRCGMLGGQIHRGEAAPEDLERMQAQGKWAAVGAAVCLAACMVCGAMSMR